MAAFPISKYPCPNHGTLLHSRPGLGIFYIKSVNMNRTLALLLLMLGILASALLAAPLRAASTSASRWPQLGSVHALIYDVSSGKTVFAKNSEVPVSIASITELMTAMVVLDAKLPLDEVVTVNSEDRDMLKNTYSRVRMGSKLSRREMLKLALMSSENRAASAL